MSEPEKQPKKKPTRVIAADEGDAELRPKVDSLMGEGGMLASILEEGAFSDPLEGICDNDGVPRFGEPGDEEVESLQIGPFKLVEEIGEGGFGMVYRAEQSGAMARSVALKIIKPGMDSREIIARFEAERKVLALMEHPNIATVLDAGTTESGRLYFVMELVKGIPITHYCDQQKLDIRRRLRLFLQVCSAIQHAHQKGIIHRDIKPSNILITQADGQPMVKVIDFGIAKALDRSGLDYSAVTLQGQLVGSPQYMSPEQADEFNPDIDTRSDIYSLGVLLYELLTGATPIDPEALSQAGFGGMQRLILDGGMRKPSTRVTTSDGSRITQITEARGEDLHQLAQILKGDLDWIVLKALEQERERRYESARGLAEDIERFMRHEPVLATPPSWRYQFGKFARRHRGAFLAATAVLLALLVGVIGMTVLYFEAVTERQKAELSRAEAVAASAAEATQRKRADRAAMEAREGLFGASLRLAVNAWESPSGTAAEVEQALASQIPVSGEMDLRDFAWRRLWNEFHSEADFTSIYARTPTIACNAAGELLSYDGSLSIQVWKTADVLTERSFEEGFMGTGGDILLSPGGRFLAIGGSKEVQIYAADSGRSLFSARVAKSVRAMVFSPDGQHVAVRDKPGIVQVLETRTGKVVGKSKLPVGKTRLLGLAFGGEFLVVAVDDQPGRLRFQLVTGRGKRLPLVGLRASATQVAIQPAGNLIAAGDERGGVCVWNRADGSLVHAFPAQSSAVTALAFAPDGSRLAVGRTRGQVSIIELGSPETVRVFKGHNGPVRSLAFFPDGQRLASSGVDRTVRIWSSERLDRERIALSGQGHQTVFSPDGKWLASISDKETVLVDRALDRVVETLPSSGWALTFSPDSAVLAIGDTAKDIHRIRFWNVAEKRWEKEILPEGEIGSLAFSPDGQFVVCGQGIPNDRYSNLNSKVLGIWNVADRTLVKELRQHRRSIVDIQFSPDGKRMYSASHDGSFHVWGTASWSSQRRNKISSRQIRALAVSPDGKTIAFSHLNDVNLWSTERNERLDVFKGHVDLVAELAFSPDGRTLASASHDETIKLWDLRCRLETRTLRGHSGAVYGLGFAPDGQELASAGADRSLRRWKAPGLERIDEDPFTLRARFAEVERMSGQGDVGLGIRRLEEIVATQQRVLGATHPDTLACMSRLAGWLRQARRFEESTLVSVRAALESVPTYGRSHSLSETLRKQSDDRFLYHSSVLRGRGDLAALREWHERLLPDTRQIQGEQRIGILLMSLGDIAAQLGDIEEAVKHLDEALSLFRRLERPQVALIGKCTGLLGLVLARQSGSDSVRVESLLRESLNLDRTHPSPHRQPIQKIRNVLAGILANGGKDGENEAEQLWLECVNDDHDRLIAAAACGQLADLYERRGQSEQAQSWRQRQTANSVSLASVPGGPPVDVLSALQLQSDRVPQGWKWNEGALQSVSGENRARINSPIVLPDEYRVELTVTRLGRGGLTVGLVRGKSAVGAVVEGADFFRMTGFQTKRHTDLQSGSHPAVIPGTFFRNGQVQKLVFVVKSDRFEIHGDGRLLVSWKVKFNPSARLPEKWDTEEPVLFVGHEPNTAFRIESWKIVPLN